MNTRCEDKAAPDYLFDSVPPQGECWQVCDGIQWVRLSLPFALDHVNCWLLGAPGQQVLVDTGLDIPTSRALWQTLFAGDGGSNLAAAPDTLLITHFHPDHYGLAGWFAETGTRLLGSAIESEMARLLWSIDDAVYGDFQAGWYATNGVPDPQVDAVRQRANTYRKIVHRPPPAASWSWLDEGGLVELGGEEYRVMIGRGHAPDMLMLYRERDHVLVAADQILPNITPNVSVMPRLQDRNPLNSFLETLETLLCLPEDTLVLPSHGAPFRNLHGRIAALQRHHELRLKEVHDACSTPHSAFDLFKVLFNRQLDAQQTSFALGESLAHLHYLEHQGRIVSQDESGVRRFLAS